MSVLQNKIDFAVVLRVEHANPNGDPLNGNRPRTDYNGYGEITDVCLKRKLRDRLQEAGLKIFVQSDDRKIDGARSLRERAESEEWGLGKQAFRFSSKESKKSKKTNKSDANSKAATTSPEEADEKSNASKEQTIRAACQKWIDVRSFGNLFAWGESSEAASVSIGIRGPVTIQSAFSVEPIADRVSSNQITKSVSGEGEGGKRSSDTMGMKHRVDNGVYVFFGSMNPQLAERTGFSDEDAEAIRRLLPRMFENDASSARPDGSMEVLQVVWWKHNSKLGQHSSAKVHRTLSVKPNGDIDVTQLDGLKHEITPGF